MTMLTHQMRNGISDNVREMVSFINKVGVSNVKKYCQEKYPRTDFNKALLIIRSIAVMGYQEAGYKHNVSRQCAEQTLKKIYKIAREAAEVDDGDKE